MKKKNCTTLFAVSLWTLLAAVAVAPSVAEACTAFVVGKKASATGYVIVGHNNDGFGPMRYAILPATDSAPSLQEQGRVGGVGGGKSTALYWQAVYSDKARVGRATGDVLLNEHGVMMFSNSGGFMPEWGGRKSVMPNDATAEVTDGGLGLALRFEVVRKAISAAEGVKIATSLIDRYGYGPDARTFTIADRNEAWILCAVRGRRYVARRCPDDAVMAFPNILPVGRILPDDIVSHGMEDKRDTFDFAGAYQGVRTKHDPSQKHRIAEFYRIAAGVDVDEGELPWSVKPTHLVSVDDLKHGFSSHAVGHGAISVHPEEVPNVAWPVCRRATLESMVCRFAADPADTRISLAPGRPCETKYDEFRPFKDPPPAYFATGAAAEKLLAGRLCVEIEGPAGRAIVDPQGGRILSWKTASGAELLFMPRRPESPDGDWSHGGISICWPWFGKKGPAASSIHGFARNRRLTVRHRDPSGNAVTLGLSLAAGDEPDFPAAADLELTLRMTERLEMTLRTTNKGDKPFTFTAGIQPYFAVSRYGDVMLRGVKKEAFAAENGMDAAFPRLGDSVALSDRGLGRELRACLRGNTGVVVWSPGNVEPHNRNLEAGDTERFIGVGPSCRAKEGALSLAPGASHELMFTVEVVSVPSASPTSAKANPRF